MSSTAKTPVPFPVWHRPVLIASALHSGLWGVFIIFLPQAAAAVYGFDRVPHDLHLWQGTGLFISLLAIGYALAASDVRQHWGLVLIGFLAKILGAIGMTATVLRGAISANVLWLLPINDLIWLWPFWRIVQSGLVCSKAGRNTA